MEVKILNKGNMKWYMNGLLHRIDGPAYIWSNGNKKWYIRGKLHRTDGPAIEWSDGSKVWCLNGFIHRKNGPAVEHPDGTKEWWIKGEKYPDESSYWEVVNRTKDLVWQICSRNLVADPGFANHLLGFVI